MVYSVTAIITTSVNDLLHFYLTLCVYNIRQIISINNVLKDVKFCLVFFI